MSDSPHYNVFDNSSSLRPGDLEHLLDELLSSNQTKRESAESWMQQNQNQPGILHLLIGYACTGVEPVLLESPRSASDGSPQLSASLEDRTSPIGQAFLEELDIKDGAAPDCVPRRALAAVLAKRLVRSEWNSRSESEKSEIKEILLHHLVKLPTIVRSTIHVVVASIAFQEGLPNNWPSLIPTTRYLLDQCRGRTSGTSAILDLLVVMAQPDEPNETLAKDLLDVEYGLQDGLLHLSLGMKQFNITKQKEVISNLSNLLNLSEIHSQII